MVSGYVKNRYLPTLSLCVLGNLTNPALMAVYCHARDKQKRDICITFIVLSLLWVAVQTLHWVFLFSSAFWQVRLGEFWQVRLEFSGTLL